MELLVNLSLFAATNIWRSSWEESSSVFSALISSVRQLSSVCSHGASWPAAGARENDSGCYSRFFICGLKELIVKINLNSCSIIKTEKTRPILISLNAWSEKDPDPDPDNCQKKVIIRVLVVEDFKEFWLCIIIFERFESLFMFHWDITKS